MEMRIFTESDWDCFAGAERPDEGEPLIGEFENTIAQDLRDHVNLESVKHDFIVDKDSYSFYIVVDRDGVQVANVDSTINFTLDCPFVAGRAIARLMSGTLSLKQLEYFTRY